MAPKPASPVAPIRSLPVENAKAVPSKTASVVGVPKPVTVAQRPSHNSKQSVTSPQQAPGARASVSQQTQLEENNAAEVSTQAGSQDAAPLKQEEQDGTPEVAQETATRKKVRRGQKKKGANGTQAAPQALNVDVSRNGNDMNSSVRSKKGWRQDPLLQPSPQNSSPMGASAGKRKSKRDRDVQESQNGWATEDATDIQDMGEFDFEANHKLFDKRSVFDQLRQDDTTADEDRLVTHNKLHRPGTYGGKNLHPTESVLSPKLAPKYGSNEVETASDADTELDFANGRSSSRHGMPRVSASKKLPSRQNSALVEEKPHPMSASVSSERGINRSVTSLAGRNKAVPALATASPRPDRTRSPLSVTSSFRKPSNQLSQRAAAEPHLAVSHCMAPCPVLHPAAVNTLESETISRYGLTPEAITESAARCIAEVALSMLDTASGSRRGSRAAHLRGSMSSSANLSSTAVVVILAGNHITGARAIAAARQLLARNVKVIIAEGQKDRKLLHEQMLQQMTTMKKLARSSAGVKRGSWTFALGQIKNLTGPPALIVDALSEGATYQDLDDTAAYRVHPADFREMVDWANRSRAPVLSVSCPGGISGLDGTSTVLEGEPVAIRPGKVLSMGAPMQGLLEAMKGGERWDVAVADIGINLTLLPQEAVPFGHDWVAALEYVDEAVLSEI